MIIKFRNYVNLLVNLVPEATISPSVHSILPRKSCKVKLPAVALLYLDNLSTHTDTTILNINMHPRLHPPPHTHAHKQKWGHVKCSFWAEISTITAIIQRYCHETENTSSKFKIFANGIFWQREGQWGQLKISYCAKVLTIFTWDLNTKY